MNEIIRQESDDRKRVPELLNGYSIPVPILACLALLTSYCFDIV